MSTKLTREQKRIIEESKTDIKNLDEQQMAHFNALCEMLNLEDDSAAKEYLWDYIFNGLGKLDW